nr:hypothetical protein [Kibdelosporangium sp. MJ126-NF4]
MVERICRDEDVPVVADPLVDGGGDHRPEIGYRLDTRIDSQFPHDPIV